AGPLQEGRRSAVVARAGGPPGTFGPTPGPADGHRPGPAGAPPNGYPGREGDKDRRTPDYLREPHPDDVFGPDPAIPPAVLGDWESGEQWRHLTEPEP
ncbi:MAG: hypothetical protein HOV94_06195, partial [Saccharothrix sp.]|nr:hypothetical protein [Saccharothrix sp.]